MKNEQTNQSRLRSKSNAIGLNLLVDFIGQPRVLASTLVEVVHTIISLADVEACSLEVYLLQLKSIYKRDRPISKRRLSLLTHSAKS